MRWRGGNRFSRLGLALAVDPATTAWVAQVVARGGTVSGTQTTNVNNLVVCLKTGATNLFVISDRLLLLASENIQQAETDLINPSATAASNSGATFTTNRGYAGDGVSAFYDTKFDMSTGTNYTLNSGTWMLYNETSGDGSGRFGVTTGGGAAFAALRMNGTTGALGFVNSGTEATQTVTNSNGIFIATRTGASATALYYNGSLAGTNTQASLSIPTAATFYAAGGLNDSGSLLNANTDVMGAWGVLAGLNGTQAAAYNTCIRTYLTAVGA